MGSTDAAAPGEITGSGKPDLLAAAASLRWVRPDLTAALADHVLESAAMAGERDLWLAAAGWALHARLATGDGRETASNIIEALPRWGAAPLAGSAAHRLRVELALVAGRTGERDTARALVAPVTADDTAPELRADAFCVLARCAVDDAPDRVDDALRSAEAEWSRVGPPCGEIGAASVALVRAAAQRQADRPDAGVDHAAEGLARLERGRGSGSSGTPSAHLAAALAAEWISALLDAGHADEAREGCVPLMPRLAEPTRPSRHLARLRLTVARTVATGDTATGTVEALEQATRDAADSDVPDLEAVCRSALGAMHEKAGRQDAALEAMRLGVAAERRDRDRTRRFLAALAALPVEAPETDLWATGNAFGPPGDRVAGRRGNGAVDLFAVASEGERSEPRRNGDRSRWSGPWSTAAAEPADRVDERRRDDELTDLTGPAGGGSQRGRVAEPADARATDLADGWARRYGSTRRNGSTGSGDGDVTDLAGDWTRRYGSTGSADPDVTGLAGEWARRYGSTASGEGDVTGPAGGSRKRNGSSGSGDAGTTDRAASSTRRNGSTKPGEAGWAWPGDDTAGGDAGLLAGRGSRDVPQDPLNDDPTGGWAVSWGDLGGDSPIGDLLVQSLRGTNGAGRGDDPLGGGDPLAGGDSVGGGDDPLRRGPAGDVPRHTAGDPSRSEVWSASEGSAESSRRSPRGVSAADHLPPANESQRSADRGRADWGSADWGRADRDASDVRPRHDEPRRGRTDPAPNGRRKHRLDDPWATGQWSMVPVGDEYGEKAPAPDRGLADPPVRAPAHEPAVSAVSDPDAWLRAALDDLERVRARSEPTDSAPALEPVGADVEGCAVAIDIVKDGRRFSGRRADEVVRALADRLTDRLPSGARLRFDEAEALSVILPGWARTDAAEWMHRTLPGLLEGFVPDDDMPGTHVRAAVHDGDGPVGAQILQRLDSGASSRGGTRASGRRDDAGRPAGSGNGRSSQDLWGDLTAAARAATLSAEDKPANGSARRRAREGGQDATRDAGRSARTSGSRLWGSNPSPGSEPDPTPDAHPSGTTRETGSGRDRAAARAAGGTAAGGRHDAAGRTPFRMEAVQAGSGNGGRRRHRRGTESRAQQAEPTRPEPESTEGLGIADLLAGALAAYRGI